MTIIIKKTLPEEIADYIGAKIIRMEIPPGERITEATITKEFDVSNNPVREAFQILEKRHLVELIPRRGARVTEVSADFVDSLFTVFTELARLLVRLCCEKRSEEDLEIVYDLLQKSEQSARKKDFESYFNTFVKILEKGLDAARNKVLTQMAKDWEPSIYRAYFVLFSQNMIEIEEYLQLLQEITALIEKRKTKTAEKLAETILTSGHKDIVKLLSN